MAKLVSEDWGDEALIRLVREIAEMEPLLSQGLLRVRELCAIEQRQFTHLRRRQITIVFNTGSMTSSEGQSLGLYPFAITATQNLRMAMVFMKSNNRSSSYFIFARLR
jgi:hypothetical protein